MEMGLMIYIVSDTCSFRAPKGMKKKSTNL